MSAPSPHPPPPPRKCASCLYDLSGVASPTCPECGYTPTHAELALAERRAVFLELTRFRQWSPFAWALLPFVALSTGYDRLPATITGLLLVGSFAWGEAAGRIFIERVPRGQLAVVRRAWRMSLVWLNLPLPLAAYVYFVVEFAERSFWSPWRGRWGGWGGWGGTGVLEPWHLGVAGLVALAIAWPLWKWSMRRLLRVAGATEDVRRIQLYTAGAKATMWPLGILIALPATVTTLLGLLDALNPHWWR